MARDKGTGKKQKFLDALKVCTSHITAVPGRRTHRNGDSGGSCGHRLHTVTL